MAVVFFHIDLDAFFASVEILDNPSYKGKPLIIGTRGERHVVSTCSYEAREYGVKSAMPIKTALKLCPRAITVQPRMKRYSEVSQTVMKIISSFSPSFLQISVDEAFLDFSDMERLYPYPGLAAKELKNKILRETGLTCSIGVAANKYVAKLASEYRKPDGFTLVPPGKEELFVSTIGLEKLWGIGDATLKRLYRANIKNIDALRSKKRDELSRIFGEKTSHFLYSISRGIDPNLFSSDVKNESISAERTFFPDLFDESIISAFLSEQAEDVMYRAMREEKTARTVQVKIRYADFTTITRQTTPESAIYSSRDVYDIALSLFKKEGVRNGIRLIGISLSNLCDASEIEGDLFESKKEREREVEKIISKLKDEGKTVFYAKKLLNKDKIK